MQRPRPTAACRLRVDSRSYSRHTGPFYVSTNNLCMDLSATPAAHIRATPLIRAATPYKPGRGGHMGAFIAWDAAQGKKVWEIKKSFLTAGNTAFEMTGSPKDPLLALTLRGTPAIARKTRFL